MRYLIGLIGHQVKLNLPTVQVCLPKMDASKAVLRFSGNRWAVYLDISIDKTSITLGATVCRSCTPYAMATFCTGIWLTTQRNKLYVQKLPGGFVSSRQENSSHSRIKYAKSPCQCKYGTPSRPTKSGYV